MDAQADVRLFLAACRARLSPEQAGVPDFSGARRVPGLRREEVAHLAGVSVDYYTRLERGRLAGVSESVLESVARALQLDDVEREHLLHLARTIRGVPHASDATRVRIEVRPEIRQVLQAIRLPAFIHNSRLDILLANDIGWALYSRHVGSSSRTFNQATFQFLDPLARHFYRDWNATARHTVAVLREAAARDSSADTIGALVQDLQTRSDDFRELWESTHEVSRLRSGEMLIRHPTAGNLDFAFEAFELASDPGLVMIVYTPDDATASSEAWRTLEAGHSPARADAMKHPLD